MKRTRKTDPDGRWATRRSYRIRTDREQPEKNLMGARSAVLMAIARIRKANGADKKMTDDVIASLRAVHKTLIQKFKIGGTNEKRSV